MDLLRRVGTKEIVELGDMMHLGSENLAVYKEEQSVKMTKECPVIKKRRTKRA